MQKPLVSVHMITYNHAPYITKAIESVLSQKTTFPFELVIGEDYSTDGTRDIVFDYAKRCPGTLRVITSDKNVGMRQNSRRVTDACRGKYIAFCEGDDYWHRDDKLQLQVDYLEVHPECGLVHSDQNRYFEETNELIESFFQTSGHIPPDKINVFRGWGGYNILTCTVMVRKALVDKIIHEESFYLDNRHIGGTDIPLFIELSMCSEIYYIKESLATYTVRRESACHFTSRAKQANFLKSVYSSYLYMARKYNVENEIERLTDKYVIAALNSALWNNDISLAKDIKNKYRLDVKQYMMYAIVTNPLTCSLVKCLLQTKYKIKKWQLR